MEQDVYFVITGDHGPINIVALTKDELEKRLRERYYTGDKAPVNVTFLTKIPDIDKGYFFWSRHGERPDHPILVIKGRIVVPKAVERVTEYQVE